jgi:hypothetical protein
MMPWAYIIVPDPSNFEFSLFRERYIDVIPVGGLDVTGDITNLLKDMRS